MVWVMLIWIYRILTCYILGYSVLNAISQKSQYCIKKETTYVFAGVVLATVYAQFFSIFYKVGLLANVGMLAVCLICVICLGKGMTEHIKEKIRVLTPARVLGGILLFILFAYGTSDGIIHYDTGLYHAQSIRWIEEYGVVPGLGNLHVRLAYNSAAFALSALYSFAFLGNQSYHCCVGLLALLLLYTCMESISHKRICKPTLSGLVRLLAVYYLLNIYDEMISPASDYFMMIMVFYIVIRWLELLENKEQSYLPYALLSVMCVSVITIKLSGAMILLLVIKPAVMMVREKRVREILMFLGLGTVTVLPFLIRNVIISGWLVYPFSSIDLFSFDFKIPRGVVLYDAKEIRAYGKGIYDPARYEEAITKWLPDWFKSLGAVDKGFFLLAIISCIMLVILGIYAWKRKKEIVDFLHIFAVMEACFIFWLMSAPLIRYGCVFLWIFPTLICGFVYIHISPGLDKYKLYIVVLVLIGCYKIGAFALEMVDLAQTEYLIVQKDYENFETVPYEINGYTFHYPHKGDRVGYEAFPSSPVKVNDIFRGDSIEDGFRYEAQ